MSNPYGYGGSPPGQYGQYPQGGPGHYGPPQPQYPVQPPPRPPGPNLHDADRRRRVTGFWLWVVGLVIGVVLNILFTLAQVIFSNSPAQMAGSIVIGGVFAFVPLMVYLIVPAVLDRFDPEPWWCLAMAFLWGAVVATGFAGMINTLVHVVFARSFGEHTGELVSAAVSAPIAEEFFKGLAILGFFYFLHREFDGIVDGIIYATFCALGFAAVENVSYYARAAFKGADVLGGTFLLRGVFTPWLHPLFTSMTGIGFGLAREAESKWVRGLAPVAGYCIGVTLHAMWNFLPTALGPAMGTVFLPWLFLWLCFVAGFFVMIVVLVVRKGRVIREYLKDEVLLGYLAPDELDLVTSPIGRIRCALSWRGAAGKQLIKAASRLALSKWHTARATKTKKGTISADFIGPLRQEVMKQRSALAAKRPR